MSWSRLCADCARTIAENNLDQMIAHDGPYFERWRTNLAASVGAVIPEKRRA